MHASRLHLKAFIAATERQQASSNIYFYADIMPPRLTKWKLTSTILELVSRIRTTRKLPEDWITLNTGTVSVFSGSCMLSSSDWKSLDRLMTSQTLCPSHLSFWRFGAKTLWYPGSPFRSWQNSTIYTVRDQGTCHLQMIPIYFILNRHTWKYCILVLNINNKCIMKI